MRSRAGLAVVLTSLVLAGEGHAAAAPRLTGLRLRAGTDACASYPFLRSAVTQVSWPADAQYRYIYTDADGTTSASAFRCDFDTRTGTTYFGLIGSSDGGYCGSGIPCHVTLSISNGTSRYVSQKTLAPSINPRIVGIGLNAVNQTTTVGTYLGADVSTVHATAQGVTVMSSTILWGVLITHQLGTITATRVIVPGATPVVIDRIVWTLPQ